MLVRDDGPRRRLMSYVIMLWEWNLSHEGEFGFNYTGHRQADWQNDDLIRGASMGGGLIMWLR